MKIRILPHRPEVQEKWWHQLTKIFIFAATLTALTLGFIVADYDDAPGAVIIFPGVIYLGSVIAYSIILRITFGPRRKS